MVSQLGERLPSFTPEESAKLNGRQTSLVQVSVSVRVRMGVSVSVCERMRVDQG